MTTAQFCIIAAIIIYLILMIYVGFYFSRQGSGSSSHEFYLGGRKLGPIVTAMSAEASDMSSWLLMGLPGAGLSQRHCGTRLDRHRIGGRAPISTG